MSNKDKKNGPMKTDFQQQNLKAWQPLLTPKLVITTFWIISVVFVIIGFIVLTASEEVVEVTKRYDNLFTDTDQVKNISIKIDKEMKPPIFFYYKLTDFYQNHRRYVKSRSDAQLRGDLKAATSGCDPLEFAPGTKKILYPCGLIANSFFNDTFTDPAWTRPGEQPEPIIWTGKGIAWKSDRESKFKNVDTNSTEFQKKFTRVNGGVTLPMPEDEDFIVWMRTAGLPNFKKLNKRILPEDNVPIPAGATFHVTINNQFPVEDFKGTKSVVLSTTSWLGGKNEFLGWAYITVGILCCVLAVAFCCKNINNPRELGDMTYFQFPKASALSDKKSGT